MPGIKCPNCGFHNLTPRDRCIRCGKPLEIVEEPTPSLFDEESEASMESSASASVEEPSQVDTDFTPREFEPEISTSQAPDKETEEVPEVPSFDESAQSRLGTETELSELSRFFKKEPEQVPEEETFEEKSEEASRVEIEKEPSIEEASLSRIEIEPSTESDFQPEFGKPIFPDFTQEEGEASTTSESAVSAPEVVSRSPKIIGGMIDFGLYLVFYLILVGAGRWALGLDFAQLGFKELLLEFFLPLYGFLLLLVWFYQFFFISVLGQSISGMLLGVEVLDKSGSRPSPLRAGLRALVYVLCLAPAGLGFIPELVGKSLPDLLAGTRTVRW